VSETGLNSTFNDGELFDSNEFCVYRCDRSTHNSIHERFDGVLVAVKSYISSERIIVPLTGGVEIVLVRLQFRNMCVYVCCLYIPSGSPISVYQQYTEALERIIDFVDMNVEDKFYVLGDFNMTYVSWITDPGDFDLCSNGYSDNTLSNVLLPFDIDSSTNADLLYCLMGAGLNQVNGVRNFQGRILDLVFCNDSDVIISKSDSPLVKIDNYHEPIDIEFLVEMDDVIEFNPDEHEFNFKKAEYDGLNAYLTSIDWDVELSSHTEVDAVVDRFYDILKIGFERYVPLKKKFSNSHPPWYSKTLSNLKNRRSRAHKRYKSSGKTTDFIKFCSLRNQFDAAQSRAYQLYLETTQENLISDPSKFWTYVNTMRKTVGYPSFMHRGDKRTTNMQDKCDLFAEFFKDVFVDDTGTEQEQVFGLSKCVDIGSLTLDKEKILKTLNEVDVSKGDGPDNISPLLLKNCSDALSTPLFHIFNLSLKSNFPTRWKESYIVPIFKSGSRSNVECYRGVAILPTFGKLFESMVCEILTDKFKNVISVSQHGFMKGRSTSTNLVDFVNEAIRIVEKGAQLDVIYTDVRKAFDRVRHRALLRKLKELGIHSSLLHWIQTYLLDRRQYVNLLGWKSQKFQVTSGIPQGSCRTRIGRA